MAKIKLPEPQKLPSGSYRIQFQYKGHRYSVTDETKGAVKKKAEFKLRELMAGIEKEKKALLTVGMAIDKYIEARSQVLSPTTVRGYKNIRRNYLQSLMPLDLATVTPMDIQLAVSADAMSGKAPKTIKNAHGLLSAVIKEFRPGFMFSTKLPQKRVQDIRILSEEEMRQVLEKAKGTLWELPILLAAWMGLRMSEILGLQFGDLQNGKLHVQRARVYGYLGAAVKPTKTVSGDRWIQVPKEIEALINARFIPGREFTDYICPQAPNTVYRNFVSICKKAGVEPCRFHDLRHFAASEGHALGIPNKYMMQRMGHKTDNMLKTVYQHTIRDQEDVFAKLIDEHMRKVLSDSHK